MKSSDPVDTPMVEKSKLDEDTQRKVVDPTHYRGRVGILMYLIFVVCMCARLVSWSSKRQKSTTISSTEAKYIASSGCCAQVLWMRSQLIDYGLGFNKIPMYCDNKSAIALCYNNVQHSRSKHIDIRFHFIKEQVENGVVELYFVNTEYQLADIFTKALGRDRIAFLINKLGMRGFTPETLKQLADEAEEILKDGGEDGVLERQGILREEVYVSQPDGFVDQDNPNHVYKLKKALYGLKQAPRAWYDLLSKFLLSQEFSKGTVDPTLFIRRQGKDILLVQIYVDDIIFASTTPELCDQFSKIMCSKFKMSMMGKISFFLGLQISQSPRGIFINQSKYALESLKKYGMESSDPVDTPMVEKSKLDEDTQGKAIDPTHYRGMVGTLMYLIASRPDLTFVVCMCARYQAKPTEKHLYVIKRIFKYLRGTVNRRLWYLKDSSIALTAYVDADRAESAAISSAKAEYIALSGCCARVLWMKSQLTDYGLGFNKNPIFYFIKEQVENGVVELYFVNTEYQLANIFTKALGRERIEFLINNVDPT
ncbi:retrovirus-related pol polyprotein from transposon TNT 1-94 [Tanacetum coccineum]